MVKMIGRILKERYEIVQAVGRGRQSEVYLALDTGSGREVAVKQITTGSDWTPEKTSKMIAIVGHLNSLHHAGIVHTYELIVEGSERFLVSDYQPGRSLRHELNDTRRGMDPVRVGHVIGSVCHALAYAHARGFSHGDLKPSSVLINRENKVFLTDFGLGPLLGYPDSDYLSPEQIKGKPPTPASDIYSLGVILFEMSSGGRKPFDGSQATSGTTRDEKIRWEHLRVAAPALRLFDPGASPQLEAIILRCMQKDPAKRYSAVDEVLDDLNKAVKSIERDEDYNWQMKPTAMPSAGHPSDDMDEEYGSQVYQTNRRPAVTWMVIGSVVLLTLAALFMTFSSVKQNKPLIDTIMTQTAMSILAPMIDQTSLSTQVIVSESVEAQIAYPAESTVVPTAEPQNTAPAATQDIASQTSKPTGWIHFRQNDQFGLSSIYTIKPDGTDSYAMTITDNYIYRDPSISLKSNKIFYVGNSMGNYRVYFYIKDVGLQAITGANDNYFYPALSPAGDRVAAIMDTGTENSLWIMNQVGGNPVQIYSTSGGKIEHPVWTPGGTSLYFSLNISGVYTIYSIKPDGSDPKQIIIENVASSWASLSPDGNGLVTTQGQLGARNLLLFDLQSKQPITIPIQGDAYQPSFSPDGEWIVFSGFKDNPGLPNGCEIYIIRRDGSDLRRVTNNSLCDDQPAWGN